MLGLESYYSERFDSAPPLFLKGLIPSKSSELIWGATVLHELYS